jgi:hypothetical protein
VCVFSAANRCSAPHIATGHVTALYSLLLVALDILLDFSTLIELK